MWGWEDIGSGIAVGAFIVAVVVCVILWELLLTLIQILGLLPPKSEKDKTRR